MFNRKNLTPSGEMPAADGVHPMRRGGARREVSERVTLTAMAGGRVLEGWALNISRGGVRLILEDPVELGDEFEVLVGEQEAALAPKGRIVWIQEEPDGVIVGVEFTGLSGTHRSAPPPPPEGAKVMATPAKAGDTDE